MNNTAGGSKVGKFGIGVRVVDDEGDVGVIVGKRKGYREVKYETGSVAGATIIVAKDFLAVAANDNAGIAQELQLEAGKFYRTRDGRKIGPMRRWLGSSGTYPWEDVEESDVWADNGDSGYSENHPDDLIAEWSDAVEPSISPEIVVNNYSGAADGENSSEWVPKVGDRVRFNTKTPEDGARYFEGILTVKRVGDDGVRIEYPPFGGWTEFPLTQVTQVSSLEPLPVAEQPAAEVADDRPDAGGGFKAGDRIVCNDNRGAMNDFTVGDFYTVKEVDNPASEGCHPLIYVNENDSCMYDFRFSLAPLTIEAGKSYRTRDGRKVGPLVIGNADSEWPFITNDDINSYRVNGTYNIDDNEQSPRDLVAEWVEPAAEVAVAEEAATEQPKFKVGSRIRRVSEGMRYAPLGFETIVSEPGRFRDADGDDTYLAEDFWEIIEPATAEAKFKVGDRVKSSSNHFTKYEIVEVHDSESLSVRVVEEDGTKGHTYEEQSIDLFSLDPDPTPVGSDQATPTFARNDLVTLAAPVKVTGTSGDRVHISFSNGGSFTLPASALIAA